MLIRFSAPIPWSQVIKRTAAEISEDNCLGLAAQLSFYFLLALFPALLFLVALIGYVPLETTFSTLLAAGESDDITSTAGMHGIGRTRAEISGHDWMAFERWSCP